MMSESSSAAVSKSVVQCCAESQGQGLTTLHGGQEQEQGAMHHDVNIAGPTSKFCR